MNMTKKQRDVTDLFKLGVLAITLTIIIFYIIIPIMNKTNKNGFAEEVAKYVKVADDGYLTDYIGDSSIYDEDICIDIHDIVNSDSKNYEGVVILKSDPEKSEVTGKYVYVTNGKYVYNSIEPFTKIDKDGITDAKYTVPRYKNCKNYEKGKMY